MTGPCSICGAQAKFENAFGAGLSKFNCIRCGNVEITGMLEAVLNNSEYKDKKYLLMGISRYRTENNLTPIEFSSSNIDTIEDEYYVPRNVAQKLNLILRYLAKKTDYAGKTVKAKPGIDYPISFSKNENEYAFFLKQLESLGYIERYGVEKDILLTVYGWNKIEEINTQVIDKKQGFIAMWFNDELKEVYENGFRKAIKDSEFEPMRIDIKEHNNKIDDEIIAEIKNSAFLIADFTGQRGGVYYEAGFAKGLGIPVIWTCKKDEIDKVHFDTRQFNHITWEKTEDLYIQLINRIKATIK